jgi:uncharacterized protein (DUF427 family)
MPDAEGRVQVTLSQNTIHNPDNPGHFMRVKPVKGRVRILLGDRVLAESTGALRVLEAGRDFLDPVLYLPLADVRANLAPVEKRTYCPLKGHASYFDLVSDQGQVEVPEIAWSYRETLDCAVGIKDLVAFDASRVAIEESPAQSSDAA